VPLAEVRCTASVHLFVYIKCTPIPIHMSHLYHNLAKDMPVSNSENKTKCVTMRIPLHLERDLFVYAYVHQHEFVPVDVYHVHMRMYMHLCIFIHRCTCIAYIYIRIFIVIQTIRILPTCNIERHHQQQKQANHLHVRSDQ